MPGKSKNLLRNPCAKEGLDHWKVLCSGGDGFQCEKPPVGCPSLKGNLPCWSTSFEYCEKVQLVYLPEFDISGDKLDKEKPQIKIRDRYGARYDCGIKYKISVRLLGEDKSTELDAWKFDDTKEEGSGWTKVKHVFKGYPSGVRYIEFKHGGQDSKHWKGHYGAKMTKSGVFVGNRKKRAVPEKLGKNLLQNPCAKSNLDGWTIVRNGGWACEKKPAGCKPIKEVNKDAQGDACWSTSNKDCEKKQVIDLGIEGFDPDFMDETTPEIKVSEWFGSRSDAGCLYYLTVRLLNSDKKTVDEKEIKVTKKAEGTWYKVEHSFAGYGPGVRFIEYSHGGHDTCNWKGNYGAKITCSFVAVVAEAATSSSSSDEE